MSRAIEVMIAKSGMSSPKISLQIMPQMSIEAQIMISQYVSNNDLTGIQSLFDNKNVSIRSESLFSVRQRSVWENTVLTDLC
jgi:hypothetical protein